MENYAITIDWLTIYTHGDDPKEGVPYISNGQIDGKSLPTRTFYLKYTTNHSRSFKTIADCWLGDEIVAQFSFNPRTAIIPKKSILVKLSNRVLYSKTWAIIAYSILNAFKLTFKGITRLDLAYDCNFFKGHIYPEDFIRNFVSKQPNEIGYIIRKGSRRFELYGSRPYNSNCVYNALRFGSRSSDIGVYLYNKSLELIEVKNKPWILDWWKENNLICLYDVKGLEKYKPSGDAEADKEKAKALQGEIDYFTLRKYVRVAVWRFEISIQGNGKSLLSFDTGELFHVSLLDLDSQSKLEELFFSYADKVAYFTIADGHARLRDYPRLQIFEHEGITKYRPKVFSVKRDAGVAERNAYHCLERIIKHYSDLPSNDHAAISRTIGLLRSFFNLKQEYNLWLNRAHDLNCFAADASLGEMWRELHEAKNNALEAIKRNNIEDEYLEYLLEVPLPEESEI